MARVPILSTLTAHYRDREKSPRSTVSALEMLKAETKPIRVTSLNDCSNRHRFLKTSPRHSVFLPRRPLQNCSTLQSMLERHGSNGKDVHEPNNLSASFSLLRTQHCSHDIPLK